jgi:hypothetical protein
MKNFDLNKFKMLVERIVTTAKTEAEIEIAWMKLKKLDEKYNPMLCTPAFNILNHGYNVLQRKLKSIGSKKVYWKKIL